MKKITILVAALALAFSLSACNEPAPAAKSTTGQVQQVAAKVQVQKNGATVEQNNVAKRLKADNTPGSIKHLYVISAMSGDIVIYSTVQGKVTSSSKRLSPTTVGNIDNQYSGSNSKGIAVRVGDQKKYTTEVLQDDGTYGSSVPYVYWFDVGGVYHQHYITGGQIFHVTDAPMNVGKIILNMETAVVGAGV